MIDECRKTITVFSKIFDETDKKTAWVKRIYDKTSAVFIQKGIFSDEGILKSGRAVIRIFDESAAVNIGDKIVIGECDEIYPPAGAYSAEETADNRRGTVPHIKITAGR